MPRQCPVMGQLDCRIFSLPLKVTLNRPNNPKKVRHSSPATKAGDFPSTQTKPNPSYFSAILLKSSQPYVSAMEADDRVNGPGRSVLEGK